MSDGTWVAGSRRPWSARLHATGRVLGSGVEAGDAGTAPPTWTEGAGDGEITATPGDRPPPRIAARATIPTRMTPPPMSRLGMRRRPMPVRRGWSPLGGRASTAMGTGLTNGPNRADSSRPTSIWSWASAVARWSRACRNRSQPPWEALRHSSCCVATGNDEAGSTAQQRCSRAGTAERHEPSSARRYGQMEPSHCEDAAWTGAPGPGGCTTSGSATATLVTVP